jgi:hypothetical protein
MKELFKNKTVEISLIKGFALGVGVNDSTTSMIVFIGPIAFEFTFPKKKSSNEF